MHGHVHTELLTGCVSLCLHVCHHIGLCLSAAAMCDKEVYVCVCVCVMCVAL